MQKVYLITDYGASPDTDALQTDFIQSAIDECFRNGGGEVVIPRGDFRTGDIRLRSHVTLKLLSGAKLIGSRDPEEYFHYLNDKLEPLPESYMTPQLFTPFRNFKPTDHYDPDDHNYDYVRLAGSRWNNALIRAFDAEDIAVIGEPDSIIDGDDPFDEVGEENYRGPHGMTFFGCKGVRLAGYTIVNTGNWAHNLHGCDNIDYSGVTALAGHDGIHMSVCSNIKITDSVFKTGDDCIAGFANVNTIVERCYINSSCSAFRFGGTNMVVRDCDLVGPGEYAFRGSLSKEDKRAGVPSPKDGGRRNMLAAFTYYADYSLPITEKPGNIVIENCRLKNIDTILHYNFSGNETWQKQRPLADITFANIDAEEIKKPLTAYGGASEPFTLTLRDFRVRFSEKSPAFLWLCNHDRVLLERVKVEGLGGDSKLIETWSEGEIVLRDVQHDAGAEIVRAGRDFACRAI